MKDQRIARLVRRSAGMRAIPEGGLRRSAPLCSLFMARPRPSHTPPAAALSIFAVDAEPPNYDCHANFSFVFIHPIIPHYSTLLKFDTANYPQVVGDLAESWSVSADRRTYTFKLRQQRAVSRRVAPHLRRCKGELRSHHPPAARRPFGPTGRLRRDHRHRHARSGDRGISSAVARRGHAGEFRLARGTASTARPSSRRIRSSRRPTSSGPGHSSLSSTKEGTTGPASAGTSTSFPAGLISMVTGRISLPARRR